MKKLLFLLIITCCASLTKPEPTKAQSPSASKPSALSPQSIELGKPLLTAWLPKDYGADVQNWAIVQDNRGVMYFGNNSGILEYDGVSWRLIQFPNKGTCRSLAKDANGRIYVGGKGDFGYLAPDSVGQMRFVSLLPQVPEAAHDFADVWQTYAVQDNVYFETYNYVFRWTSSDPAAPGSEMAGEMKIWKPDKAFHQSFVVDEVFYIREWEKGLLRMQGDTLQLVPGGEQFADERIYVMLPFRATASDSASSVIPASLVSPLKAGIQTAQKPLDSRLHGSDTKRKIESPNPILVGTRTQGLFLYDGQTFHPFKTEADAFLQQNPLYSPGAVLSDGRLLLNTTSGGAVLLDHNGKLLQNIDRSSGLPDNTVYYVYSDPTWPETQWLGLENGIARVEATGPLSTFDAERGLESTITKVQRHHDVLYATTSVGIFYLDATSGTFKPVTMPVTQAWDFLAIDHQDFTKLSKFRNVEDGQLLAATNDGVYAVNGDQVAFVRRSVNRDYVANVFHRSRQDSQRVFVGLNGGGLACLRREKGIWRDEGRAPGIPEEIRTLVETEDGKLWAGTRATGVLLLTLPGNGEKIWQDVQVERFGPQQGLPDGWAGVYEINGTPYFSTVDNIYRFDAGSQRFAVDSTFMVVPSDGGWILDEDERERVWVIGKGMALGTPQTDSSYQWLKASFRRFSDEILQTVYSEENGVVWFGTANGLIRYDSNVEINYATDYPALVRRVVAGEDSLIFGGTVETSRRDPPTLAYADNNLAFAYSAPAYEDAVRLQFQTWLEGFDEHWSNWNNKIEKEYTNLPEGDYHFRVRAKNIYEHVSQEAVYSFTILPPWWRTWWAYGGYAVLFGLLLLAGERVQRQRLLKKERERAEFREAKLRAEAENERRRNLELLSEIGKEITASLDMDTIFYKLYEHVNQLADAGIFGVGIYDPAQQQIEYRLAIERGQKYLPYTRDTRDKNQFPVWCIENRRPVFINDVRAEHSRYISQYKEVAARLEDGTLAQEPQSLLYLPLISHEKVLGVITIQSFKKNAYTNFHLNLLQSLAAYTTIALDNAEAYRRLDATLQHLKSAQQQLVTQEKLASLGQLTAGIAHEIKNPLNFVNNFAVLSVDLAKELREEIGKIEDGGARIVDRESLVNIEQILHTLEQNAQKINHHGQRADNIVQSMMQHARGGKGERQPTDLNALVEEYVNLAYHGMRAKVPDFNVTIGPDFGELHGKIEMVPQDIGRVLLNLLSNAFDAVRERAQTSDDSYTPMVMVSTRRVAGRVEIRVRDNGGGIPDNLREKIFEPFFTTKPTGSGTGLGLSLAHDIVTQGHGGTLTVESTTGEGASFVVTLPRGA